MSLSNKIIMAVLVLVVAGGAGFLMYKTYHTVSPTQTNNQTGNNNNSPEIQNYSIGGKVISNKQNQLVVQVSKIDKNGQQVSVLYNVSADINTVVNKVSLSTHKSTQIGTADIPVNSDIVVFTKSDPSNTTQISTYRVDYTMK